MCHKENIWWREKRGKRPSDRLRRHAQPVHCCHSLHLLTFSIMSFTHGCFFLPFYTSLITLLCLPPPPPSIFIVSPLQVAVLSLIVWQFFYFFIFVWGQPAQVSHYWSERRMHEGRTEEMQSDMSRTWLQFMWWNSQEEPHKNTRTWFF